MNYPATRRDNITEEHFDTAVADVGGVSTLSAGVAKAADSRAEAAVPQVTFRYAQVDKRFFNSFKRV